MSEKDACSLGKIQENHSGRREEKQLSDCVIDVDENRNNFKSDFDSGSEDSITVNVERNKHKRKR